ncbi:hypothetical protein HMPREF9629_01607 [Peptoanaerobacter stomatis]|uniref:Uncharacterized protein n=1 Tax=Peptoanaerobacter stomatis TaxID=796937 RepID=G9WZK6_9FIRM|nr:hypothetical protein [Peptoanaerobacter stomatis]EHL15893.1 hypothetical protein HMPREF9629_01607 [Peptoanaerobacter stomatis]
MKIQIIPIKIGDMNTNEIVIENSQKIKVAFFDLLWNNNEI